MADYTIIARTGKAILQKLREELIPDLLKNENEIGLCEPHEKSDYKVKVCLYDITENTEIRPEGMVQEGLSQSRYPSIFLNLFYMITVASQSDLRFRAEEEALVLGKILQVFHDESMKKNESLPQNGEVALKMQLLKLTQEEKAKIWAYPGVPYKLSLFYRVIPVEIESRLTRGMARVREASFAFEERTEKDEGVR